jgi:HAD superfamily hydrolase (TIGR01509 family)
MLAKELKKKYMEFFVAHKHKEMPSASLIPENDPTVLFTTAGMHPLVPFLLGQPHPLGKRIVNVQKCLRTDDIDEVGDEMHLTFIEMLGNWSLGDYFKKEAIEWSFEFLTKILKLDEDRISVTVFAGDKDAPKDEESAKVWQKLGIPKERIFYNPKKDNWWGPAGKTGPCGPCTEMFYDTGKKKCSHDCKPGCNCGKYFEIWNDVFMEYNKSNMTLLVDGMFCLYDKDFRINEELLGLLKNIDNKKILVVNGYKDEAEELLKNHGFEVFSFEGKIKKDNEQFFKKLLEKYSLNKEDVIYFDHAEENIKSARNVGILSELYKNNNQIKKFIEPNIYRYIRLKQQNVDAGMGLERTAAMSQGKSSVYDIELFVPIMEKIQGIAKKQDTRSERIIADHLRAAVFVLAEGIAPSNLGHGYILRRLVRRAIRHGKQLDVRDQFCSDIAKIIINIHKHDYPELEKNEHFILSELAKEEERFERTLEKGMKKFEEIIKTRHVTGKGAFLLFQSYGFPLEMTEELAKERKIHIDKKEFDDEFKKHQELSRQSMQGVFKSGLADNTETTIRYHTATHLLHQALREVLGDEVIQKGSNITPERLRFDFSYPRKPMDDEIRKVEKIVNEKIKEGLDVRKQEMTPEQAKKSGAICLFGHKYGEKVFVYTIGCFSKEICSGPHVENIKELGKFVIVKEEAVSAGVRRIKAILEQLE